MRKVRDALVLKDIDKQPLLNLTNMPEKLSLLKKISD
jgi:hypothetical protein